VVEDAEADQEREADQQLPMNPERELEVHGRHEKGGKHGDAAGKRNGAVMELPSLRYIDEADLSGAAVQQLDDHDGQEEGIQQIRSKRWRPHLLAPPGVRNGLAGARATGRPEEPPVPEPRRTPAR